MDIPCHQRLDHPAADHRPHLSNTNLQHLLSAAYETLKSTSAILVIVSVASLFGWIMAIEQIPQVFARELLSFSKDPLVLLMIANAVLLIAGMFLDSTTATLLVIPIISVPLHAAGVDPIHLGIAAIFNLMVDIVTPPMGLAIFLIVDIAKVSMRNVLRELLPFYIPLVCTLLIITFLPQLTLWLPKMMR
jgi:TRAP-type C4-dicarboxylate transport system permease large subunit